MRHAVIRLLGALGVLVATAGTSFAQGPLAQGPAHPEIPDLATLLADLDAGVRSINDLRALGLSVFATPFNVHDGLGDGPFDPAEIDRLELGHRPTLPEPLGASGLAGRQIFDSIGCSSCHVPAIATERRSVPLAHPEIAHQPFENVYLEIDLAKVGFQPTRAGGVNVPMFSDLKRHKMGPGLAETFERAAIANDEFVTARLWGIADTAPYLHDGRATTLFDAITWHGGEAQAAHDAFLALDADEQAQLLTFLGTLRTPVRPNQELVKLVE